MPTIKAATPVAIITPTEAGDLSTRGNSASFFAITPTKGARVAGTVAVGMTSHELEAPERYAGKVSHPAMWIDFTPMYETRKREFGAVRSQTRATIDINGKTYGAAMFESVSGYVECYPVMAYRHLANYGYPVVTIDGARYVLRFRLSMFDTVSPAARNALEAIANTIAAEYITTVRWLGKCADSAKRAASNAADALNEAQAKYDAAAEAMRAAQAAYLIAINADENWPNRLRERAAERKNEADA